MRKIFSFYGMAMLTFFSAAGQKNVDTMIAKVYYRYYVMYDTINKLTSTENMILYVGKHSSIYKSYDKIYNDSLFKELVRKGSPDILDRSKNGMRKASSRQIVKNYDHLGKLSVYENIVKDYVINDDISNLLNWRIGGETKQIENLTVTKASCSFRGRKYEAWFCADLPIQDGPFKFSGLPGLIIEMIDGTGAVKYSFSGFQNVETQNVLMPVSPAKAISITHKEYVQLMDAFRNDPVTFMNNASADLGLGISDIKIDGSTNKKISNPVNNPVELEDY